MRKKSSIFWTMPKQELQTLLNKCYSFSDILKIMNMCVTGHQYKVIQERIKIDNLDISHFNHSKCMGAKQSIKTREIPFDKIFIENSNSDTSTVRKKILKFNLITYICKDCGNTGIWNNKSITLQLEHKNGNRKDHRLENLCFLCPNCHTQTSTYGKKKRL